MKKLISTFLLVFSLSFYAQNDTISVVKKTYISSVSVKSNNILYRGILNEIFIDVPNKQTLIASSPGLTIENNKFYISPSSGLEQKLLLRFKSNDGTFVNEEYTFQIKNIPIVMGFINDNNCQKCLVEMNKNELKDAIISLKFPDVMLDVEFIVTKFIIMFPNGESKTLNVNGNKIDNNTIEVLNKLSKGTVFYIWDFGFKHNLGNTLICKTTPIKVIIID